MRWVLSCRIAESCAGEVMDVLGLQYGDSHFNAVIDKGTMDSILVGILEIYICLMGWILR